MKIPEEVKKMIESQGIVAIGTSGGAKFVNITPRTFFTVEDDAIFWLDFFKHKSFRNYTVNPNATVAVYDKEEYAGYQIHGRVSILTDESKCSEIKKNIFDVSLNRIKSEKAKKMKGHSSSLIMFEPKVIYSLIPEEFSNLSISSDIEPSRIFFDSEKNN
ncbi:pyridoxamine 5'-phosphate oxidase family protein [Nitrosopumilus sp. b1]|uniref:pyridoxamine 5'-phosphate oxidase family protein n=1 Tax=Nitrosopumilus sp. b1 TaxID=2109907 RepID=UPI0015F74E84|nr:pyridoxamine 5'-phosphate oxidase family protein [Nitrosopumilus sp. b1]KAF6242146.1 pyridoxamine 5'-phosphate oxidase family protein [Nitrosopumilus sp. b1]